MKPILGDTDTGALAIDVERLLETRLLIQGGSGAGKSSLARVLMEQLPVQVIVLDVEDEHAHLREKLPVALGGPDGDFPVDPRSAALLARRLIELNLSAVLNIFELKGKARPQFVKSFLETLMSLPRSLWHDAVIVIEEAYTLAPQGGDKEGCTEAVVDLMSRGRKRGFCGIPVSLRLADIEKSVVAQCQNRIIGLETLDADVKRAAHELGFDRERAHELRRLEKSEFFAFGPAISREVVKFRAAQPQTSHGKRHARRGPPPPPPEKIRGLLGKIGDLPEEARQQAKDFAEAMAQNRELERKLRELERVQTSATPSAPKREQLDAAREQGKREAAASVSAEMRTLRNALEAAMKFVIEVNAREIAGSGVGEAERAALEKAIAAAVASATKLLDQKLEERRADLDRLKRQASRLLGELQKVMAGDVAVRVNITKQEPFAIAQAPERRGARAPAAPPADGLTGPMQRILDAIAWLEACGIDEPEQSAVAWLADYSGPENGAYKNPRATLNTNGLVTYSTDGRIRLTDSGRALARRPDAPGTTKELQERVLARLPGPERKILTQLLESYPDPIENDALARGAGYSDAKNGAYKNPRSRLRSLGFIDYVDGRVVARSVLFLERRG
ncbi:MAG TPA: DUF87 domain-containing protein [Myxococcota bacterium]|nr:DUF87 domain-containing protein [Myxococcota bacterium]